MKPGQISGENNSTIFEIAFSLRKDLYSTDSRWRGYKTANMARGDETAFMPERHSTCLYLGGEYLPRTRFVTSIDMNQAKTPK